MNFFIPHERQSPERIYLKAQPFAEAILIHEVDHVPGERGGGKPARVAGQQRVEPEDFTGWIS